MKPRKHVHFDFFGTLVGYAEGHTGANHEASYDCLVRGGAELTYPEFLDEWTAAAERSVRHAQASLDEFTMYSLCAAFLETHLPESPGADVIVEFRDTFLDEWSRGVVFIPQLGEMLEALTARCRLAVVSNTHHGKLVTGLLTAAGIRDHFADVIVSVEHGRRKPCPSIFRHALAVAGASADVTTFVGDSWREDYQGARDAGLHALLIDPAAAHPLPDEDRIRSVLEVPDRIG